MTKRTMKHSLHQRVGKAAILLALAGSGTAHGAAKPDPLAKLFDAIGFVESSSNPDIADHDDGGSVAVGEYQIHQAYWLDSRTPGKFSDCHDPAYSRRVMLNYWRRYCPKALAQSDLRTLAMIHHGGPHGSRDTAYWDRVQKALNK